MSYCIVLSQTIQEFIILFRIELFQVELLQTAAPDAEAVHPEGGTGREPQERGKTLHAPHDPRLRHRRHRLDEHQRLRPLRVAVGNLATTQADIGRLCSNWMGHHAGLWECLRPEHYSFSVCEGLERATTRKGYHRQPNCHGG